MDIRHLTQLPEFERCEELQKTVWGFADLDIVPSRMMIIAQQHGGLAMGAFDAGEMVAFLFAFASVHDGRPAQHSHMLGVLQSYRDRGIGRSLKLAQYRDAVDRGFPLVTWTFDPLETRNAFLNLNRLGAVTRTYRVNLYGEKTSSELHSGLGTDRFLVEWRIGTPRVERILQGQFPQSGDGSGFPRVLEWQPGGRFLPGPVNRDQGAEKLCLEAPPDIQLLKQIDREASALWRESTRLAFQHYFSKGYSVRGLLRTADVLPVRDYSLRRAFYLLEPDED